MSLRPASTRTDLGRRRLLLAAPALAAALAGCASLVEDRAPRLYDLTPALQLPDGLPRTDAVISVEVPPAKPGLNTSRIALQPQPGRFDYYARARWVDVVPVMIRALTLETLAASGLVKVTGLQNANNDLRPTHVLSLAITKFQAVYDEGTDNPPLVDAQIYARITQMRGREEVGGVSLQEVARADGTSIPAVVEAFGDATERLLAELTAWTVEAVADGA